MFDFSADDWQEFRPTIVRVTPLSKGNEPDGTLAYWTTEMPTIRTLVMGRAVRKPSGVFSFAGVTVDLGGFQPEAVPFALEWWDLVPVDLSDDEATEKWRHALLPMVRRGDDGTLTAVENPQFGAGPGGEFTDWPCTDRCCQWMLVDGPPGAVFVDDDGQFVGWAAPARAGS